MTAPSKCPRCGALQVGVNHSYVWYECGTKYFGPDYVADASTLVSRECNRREIARLRGVLTAVTISPLVYHACSDRWECQHCRAEIRNAVGHKPDCPWAEARELLKETSGE